MLGFGQLSAYISAHAISFLLCSKALEIGYKPTAPKTQGKLYQVTSRVYPNQKNGWTFPFTFEYFPPSRPDLPTIVIAPGGPGVGFIGRYHTKKQAARDLGLREEDGILLFDPRTVDFNKRIGPFRRFPINSLQSEYLAYDYALAIRALGLTHYAIYGGSHGTTVGTIMAHLLENDGGAPPNNLVLAGTVGPATQDGRTTNFFWIREEWERLFKEIPRIAQDRFTYDPKPLGKSRKWWGEIIEYGLYEAGSSNANSRKFRHLLKEILSEIKQKDPENDARVREKLTQHFGEDDIPNNKWSELLYVVITCRELTSVDPIPQLFGGRIVPIPNSNKCKKFKEIALTLPWNPKKYPVRAPIIYLQGTRDAATPSELAREHLKAQSVAPRYWIEVNDFGHHRFDKIFMDCVDSVWTAIFSGSKEPLETALKNCKAFNHTGYNFEFFAPTPLVK